MEICKLPTFPAWGRTGIATRTSLGTWATDTGGVGTVLSIVPFAPEKISGIIAE